MEEKALSNTTIALMAATALFYDALQVVLAYVFAGWLVMPIFYLHFTVWFWMKGLKFFQMKRAPTVAIGSLLEFVTFGIIPSFTFIVLRVSLDYRIREVLPESVNKVISSTPGFKKVA